MWALIKAVVEMTGFVVQLDHDCASADHVGLPTTRQRAFIVLVRKDNSSPAPMVLPQADDLVGFTKPPVEFVPATIDDVIAPDSVALVRGAMALAHDDFLRMKVGR